MYKDEVEANMSAVFTNDAGKSQELVQVEDIDPDLNVVLSAFTPILGAAMGNMGTNMHFFVLDDKGKSSSRLVNPYKKGKIDIQLAKRDKGEMQAVVEMPLNSLFIPRTCPNGKEAHISWSYCPWSGNKLTD